MICDPCKAAADHAKLKWHKHCTGCDCQHHPVGTRQIKKEAK